MFSTSAGAASTGTSVPVSLPRWEWRTFGDDLTRLARRLDAPELGRGRWADEVHLVCLQSSHHAWIQRGTLEMRWRKEVGFGGFELWDPIIRTALPFDPDAVARMFAAWGLGWNGGGHALADVNAFLDAVERSSPAVCAVRLARRRERTAIDGVECSLETLTTGPESWWQSLAIEHEDPNVVTHALGRLGLEAGDNVNFIQGLKQAFHLNGDRR